MGIAKSLNFEMLRSRWPELAGLGAFAEYYAYPDPSGALVKLRSFAEAMVLGLYHEMNLPQPEQPNLFELLTQDAFRAAVPRVVLDKLHSLRLHGNKAAHGETFPSQTALIQLKEAFDLARWLFVTLDGGQATDCPDFQGPEEADAAESEREAATQEARRVREQLADQEARMQRLLAELEEARARAQAAHRDVEELRKAGKRAAEVLDFDEETTRYRLIDSQLAAVGWKVGVNGGDTDEVGQEVEVPFQPTSSGTGYADYVLWDDDGLPLAVIEAKKTAVDPENGRTQARLYADGMESKHGRRPAIFYTNGFDIWLWDDAQDYPPRKVYGFYSKDSLQYLVTFQRSQKKALNTIEEKPEIAGRLYQTEAIRRVKEKFTQKHRKALIVQATGTGKTRVAISIAEVLIRANWAKRILFICDRRELRKQAKNAFKNFINEPLTVVKKGTEKERHKRIYLATYPAMMKIYQGFDVGFFDLIIADESHRSIYNRYRDLFHYFDSLQVGLTATPVEYINRNTYDLFGCENQDPTAYYSLDQAVEDGWLAPYEVYTHTTKFLRSGIKYDQLTEEQKQQLEQDGEEPELFDYENTQVDKVIYNKDTNRAIIRNLMENGIREATGQHPGKTIIFARNHRHALMLQELFNEMYPQYAGRFCQVIDNYDVRAEQLIDDFKGLGNNKDLTVAISVDMLDTGIDILEIVNLVFAKPVRSKVKFQQMIGRGTRLCANLFGPGQDKTVFRIFDHWGNFEFFDQDAEEAAPGPVRSLMQNVFDSRLVLAEADLENGQLEAFNTVIKLVQEDINRLDEKTVAVRDRWREKRALSKDDVLREFSPTTVAALREVIGPLMQWANIREYTEAYAFDLLMTRLQTALVNGSGAFDDLKADFLNRVAELQLHLNPVREKLDLISQVKRPEFWSGVSFDDLETARVELRGIIHFHAKSGEILGEPKVIDIEDGEVQYSQRLGAVNSPEMKAYEIRVEQVLKGIFDHNPTLQKIREGRPVTDKELTELTSLVLTQNPDVDLKYLKEFYPHTAVPLDFAIRRIIGLDPAAVEARFAGFVRQHPRLTARQVRFLGLLQNHISRNGAIEVERLYDAPFTTIDSNGLDGVFPEVTDADDIVAIIKTFMPESIGEETRA